MKLSLERHPLHKISGKRPAAEAKVSHKYIK